MSISRRLLTQQSRAQQKCNALLTVPALVAYAVLILYPFLNSARFAFYRSTVMAPEPVFRGFDKFARLFGEPDFLQSWLRTLVFVGATTALTATLGLCWAIVLNQGFRGARARLTTTPPSVSLIYAAISERPAFRHRNTPRSAEQEPQRMTRIARHLALAPAIVMLPGPAEVVSLAYAQSAGGEKRLALVVGNAAYKQFPLDNPVRDARGISAELQKLGFEVITFENISAAKFRKELASFARRIKAEEGVSVFYYAGHGIGVRGRNLLVPVDTEITDEESAFAEPVDVDAHLLNQIERGKKHTNLIILDACRDDPFAGRNDAQKRRGLVEMGAKNSLVAFATRPGDVAEDEDLGKNGMFTGALLAQMDVPGLEVRSLLTRVRAEVLQKTRQRQYPYVNDLLLRDFVLRAPIREKATANSRWPSSDGSRPPSRCFARSRSRMSSICTPSLQRCTGSATQRASSPISRKSA